MVLFIGLVVHFGERNGIAALVLLFSVWALIESVKLFRAFPMGFVPALLSSIVVVGLPMAAFGCHVFFENPVAASIDYAVIVILLIGTKCQDIFAYFSGSFFGKHPLAPSISPKKTWEGAIGGVLGSGLMTWAFASLWDVALPLMPVVYGLILGLGSLLGDLTESKIKRKANIKDSGNVLPGFGGVFDMVDSLIFAAPFSLICYHEQLMDVVKKVMAQ